MATTKLTAKQRRLKTEIDDIAAAVTMDHWNIAYYDEDARTAILGVMKVKLVRAEIIMKYLLIDEFLSVIISHYYFIRPKKGLHFARSGKPKSSRYSVSMFWMRCIYFLR
jgi:hypothetical protein